MSNHSIGLSHGRNYSIISVSLGGNIQPILNMLFVDIFSPLYLKDNQLRVGFAGVLQKEPTSDVYIVINFILATDDVSDAFVISHDRIHVT